MDASLSQVAVLIVQVATGVSLAACAGLRAFLPLFAVGLAGRLEWLPLTRSFEWLESTPALTVFGVAVLAEIAADKIPVVDHFLDAVQGIVKPIAGTVVAACVLTELTPLQSAVVGIVGGGTVAGAVHLGKAQLRLLSSASTVGVANPALSIGEDAGAFLGTAIALVLPLLAALLLLVAALALGWTVRRVRRRWARPAIP